tara:strand:- start:7177 stop:8466 length:1290 start_codon:yes stop_codon:yes gene_type:complete
MVLKSLTVDNYITALILSSLSKNKVKLSSSSLLNNKHNYYCTPSNLLLSKITKFPLDTFGILKKNKLLLREPIVGEQISYANNNNNFEVASKIEGIHTETLVEKKFFFYALENYPHKYLSSIFTNLKRKNINIIFPDSETVHLYSDDQNTLKKYIKKLSNINCGEDSIYEFNIPKEISILENDKIINNITIENQTFLGMTFQLSRLLQTILKDNSQSINSTNNQNHYLNNLFFTFYHFLPNFLSSFIFKFLLRMNGAINFSNQVLELANLYTYENHIFSNPIDDEQSLILFNKGYFLPKVFLLNKKKDLSEILHEGESIICCSSLDISSKNNVIQLKHTPERAVGFTISKSSYDLLKLDKCYYVVSSTGLIKMVDINYNFQKKVKPSSSKSKYSDHKQKSLDSFISKNYKPSLPKFNFSFKMPFRPKKQ